jgi:hypothetical protein
MRTRRNQLPEVPFFVTCERRGLLAGYHVRYQLLWLSFRGWGVLAVAGLKLCKIRLLPSKAFFDLAMACPLVAVRLDRSSDPLKGKQALVWTEASVPPKASVPWYGAGREAADPGPHHSRLMRGKPISSLALP